MGFLKLKYHDGDIIKTGRIGKHSRKTKSRRYESGKIYLPRRIPIGSAYTLLEFDEVEYQDIFDKKTKLKGYLLLLGRVKPY
jgi:hypothetical protein